MNQGNGKFRAFGFRSRGLVLFAALGVVCLTGCGQTAHPRPTPIIQTAVDAVAAERARLAPTPTAPLGRPTPPATPSATPSIPILSASTPTPTPVPLAFSDTTPGFITLADKVFLKRSLGDVEVIYAFAISDRQVEQAIDAARMAWEFLSERFGIDRRSVPTMYLTRAQDTINEAIDRDIKHPGWLAGFASRKDRETWVIAGQPSTYRTVAHEVTHFEVVSNLPLVDEGVAEFAGFVVGSAIDPEDSRQDLLQSRANVRRAAVAGTTFSVAGMLAWEQGVTDRDRTSLFYSQSWWFIDHLVASYGDAAVGAFIRSLNDGDPFPSAFDRSFAADPETEMNQAVESLLSSPLHEEAIAASLGVVWATFAESFALAPEWNSLIHLINTTWVGPDVGSRWTEVSRGYRDVQARLDALGVDNVTADARGILAEALGYYADAAQAYGSYPGASGGLSLGSTFRGLAIGRQEAGRQAIDSLLEQYPWGL